MKETDNYKDTFKEILQAVYKNNHTLLLQILRDHSNIFVQKFEKGRNFWHLIADSFLSGKDYEGIAVIAEHARNFFRRAKEDYESFFLAQDEDGNTALHLAWEYREGIHFVRFFLSLYEKFVTQDLQDKKHVSNIVKQKIALYVNVKNLAGKAVINNVTYKTWAIDSYISSIKYLITKGAYLNLADNNGVRPYDYWGDFLKAVYHQGHLQYALIIFYYAKLYVQNGVNPEHIHYGGSTLINLAQKYSIDWTEEHSADLRLIYQACKQGKQQKATNNRAKTIDESLFFSSIYTEFTREEAILQEKMYDLLAAVEDENIVKIKQLIENRPAILTIKLKYGHNFWHILGMSINLLSYEAVKIVVECAYNYLQNVPKGDDSFFLAQDQDGNTALHLAMKKKREPLGWNLLSAYKDTLKAKGCSLSTVRQKVAALVNAQDRQGRTILYYLPLNYDLPIYIHRYAAENAGNVNVVDNEGNRPACVVFGNFVREFPDCSMYEAFECARTFVINGANPDQPNENGETIINLAQKNIKAWTVEATEDLRLAYFMSLKRKIRQELNHDPQALDKSVILTSDVLVNTPKVDQFVNNEIVLAKKLSEVIECSTLKEFRQRIKENPASLVQRNELGLTFWHYIAGLSSFDYQKIKIAASLAWQYQKAIQDRNCFFETRDVYGDTVILIAIKKGLNAHAQYLLSVYEEVLEEAGLDQAQVRKQIRAIVNMADRDGKSVMHNLFFESEKVLDTAKFFTAKGANLNLADNNGNRPHECWCCFIKDSHEKGEAIAVNSAMQFARFYVENGINPDWLSREDETIITIVQKYCSGWEEQHTIKLRQLYQKYLKKQSITQTAKDHNAQDIDEREDLTSTSNKRISELAIQFSGNPAVRTRELDELFAAIERYDRDRVAILIEENPTILTRTNELGWNCWHLIGNDPHLGLLVIGTVVECAVRHLNRVLKEHDSFFLARTSNGDTALQIAIKNKRNEHAKFLLTTYEEALIKECHDKGLPRTLVEQKLSTLINMRDLNGRTIMHNIHINYMYPYFKSLQFFIAKGADIYSADNEGNLASHIIYGNFIKDGCKWYNFKSYEVFCYGRLYARNNINPDLANTAGETLISIAKKYVKDWTEEDSEELRLIYLASLRRSLYKEEVTEEKAETPAASIAGKTPERVNTVPVIEINRARTVYGQDFSMLFNAIEWKNLPCLYQLIKKKPAALNNELKDEDNTYVSDNIIERTEEKLPIVASWVRKYLKTCPGGYDRFFLTCDDKGNTALQIAMKKGHQGLAEFLLSVYEQVLTDDGLTPTQIQEKVAAYVNIPDHKGRTIMHNLDYEREGVLNTAEFFIAKGANLELVDAKGNKSYDYLSNFLKRSHAKGKAFDALATLDLVRVYVEHGVNPDQEKRGGKTLIRIAQRYSTSWSEKHNALLRLLYQFNVNPSQVQPYTST